MATSLRWPPLFAICTTLHWPHHRQARPRKQSVHELQGGALAHINHWAAQRQSRYVCICNAHSVVTATQDPRFLNDTGGTYRAVYTVKFEEAVFILHCFQKKSKRGIATPKEDMEIIRARLKVAEALAKELRNENASR
jgi:hypothetical protein